jgi:hypothetical protein
MGGNPGENLILLVFYISLAGLGGAIIVAIWIKISDYIVKKNQKKFPVMKIINPKFQTETLPVSAIAECYSFFC